MNWNDINPHRQSYQPKIIANRGRWLQENNKFSNTESYAIRESFIPRGATNNPQDVAEADEEERILYRTSGGTPQKYSQVLIDQKIREWIIHA